LVPVAALEKLEPMRNRGTIVRYGHAVPHLLTACERNTAVDASPAGTPYSNISCLGNLLHSLRL